MNKMLELLLKVVGVEKLFLMVWNRFYPILLKKANSNDVVGDEWDEQALMFFNELVVLYTGKPADVKKPEELKIRLEKFNREVSK